MITSHTTLKSPSIEDIFEIDNETRRKTKELILKLI
jgi:hypothetical protein